MHAERIRLTGDPGPAHPLRGAGAPPKPLCAVDDCDRVAKSRGWCDRHYGNWRTTGTPLPKKERTGRRQMAIGYIAVWKPGHPVAQADHYAMEHRYVAYEAGLLTDLSMHVHHRNGDKTDNRIENLEVMDPSAHTRHHVAEAGVIENQHGVHQLRQQEHEVGITTIAQRLGLTLRQAQRYRDHGGMPAPARLERSRQPVWHWPEIEVWARDAVLPKLPRG